MTAALGRMAQSQAIPAPCAATRRSSEKKERKQAFWPNRFSRKHREGFFRAKPFGELHRIKYTESAYRA